MALLSCATCMGLPFVETQLGCRGRPCTGGCSAQKENKEQGTQPGFTHVPHKKLGTQTEQSQTVSGTLSCCPPALRGDCMRPHCLHWPVHSIGFQRRHTRPPPQEDLHITIGSSSAHPAPMCSTQGDRAQQLAL